MKKYYSITGIQVTERVPDKLLQMADEVVNIDLTADELIARLKEGKIYDQSKVETALQEFFPGRQNPAAKRTCVKGSSFAGRAKN